MQSDCNSEQMLHYKHVKFTKHCTSFQHLATDSAVLPVVFTVTWPRPVLLVATCQHSSLGTVVMVTACKRIRFEDTTHFEH